jgi:hypothetical protein
LEEQLNTAAVMFARRFAFGHGCTQMNTDKNIRVNPCPSVADFAFAAFRHAQLFTPLCLNTERVIAL